VPGGFAHLTAVGAALDRLDEIDALPLTYKRDLPVFRAFMEIGAVGPDYPYLGFQGKWADNMHYHKTGDMIRRGADAIRGMPSGSSRTRCLAWLLGYSCHVAADLTIHPVVGRRVGPYAEHAGAHRTCEMHQDAFIWPRNNLGEIGVADYVRQMIEQCSTPEGGLDSDVAVFWQQILKEIYPEDFAGDRPNINRWNNRFKEIVDLVDDVGAFFSFTRHTLADQGMAYPATNKVDRSYIENLETPEGVMNYDDIFDHAVGSVIEMWKVVANAIFDQAPDAVENWLAAIPDADLDTGERFADHTQVYWRVA